MACDRERDIVLADSQREYNQFGVGERSRREFLIVLAAFGMSTALACSPLLAQDAAKIAKSSAETPKTFRVWVFSDAHVGRDKKYGPRESLAEALRQSESASGFDWDIALDLGDVSGEVELPKDPERGRDRPAIWCAKAAPP